MTNATSLLKIPLHVVEAVVPWRRLPVPIEIQHYLNERTLAKSFWNQCAFGPNQLGVVQAIYRKQATTLNRSSVNNAAAINWVVDKLPITSNSRVLDLNTGTGVVARAVASRGAKEVVGTDISRHLLAFAQAQPSKVEYIRAKSQELPLPDNSFDVVVSRLAFNHIAEVDAVVREITRVLKPGGYVAIVERVFPAELDPARFEQRLNSLENIRDPSHIRFLSVAEISSLLSNSGVAVKETATTEVTETLSAYLNQTQTLPPNREHISQWVNGNITSDDPDHNQITGFKPVLKEDDIYLTHTHAFVGGVLTKE